MHLVFFAALIILILLVVVIVFLSLFVMFSLAFNLLKCKTVKCAMMHFTATNIDSV